nr:hypothetical protein [Nostoc sp. 'Lobaria pulmonaria (5183) cyanobiont']
MWVKFLLTGEIQLPDGLERDYLAFEEYFPEVAAVNQRTVDIRVLRFRRKKIVRQD